MSQADQSEAKRDTDRNSLWRKLAFPLGVAVLYIILFAMMPERTIRALRATATILTQVAVPLGIAFVIMFVLNMFVKPAHVTRLLGKGARAKGVVISALAGMVSTGPIYAWYPLLKDLREKGASEFHVANFLSHRAVKPFLLPVMVLYFGWMFTLVFNVLIVAGALLTALVVSGLTRDSGSHAKSD